jgi:hypothetical protein
VLYFGRGKCCDSEGDEPSGEDRGTARGHLRRARHRLPARFRCGPESAVCCSVAEASAATLREMNPLVRIEALPGDVSEEPDTDFLRDFDVVLLPQAPLCMQLAYDKACTELNTAFFTACSRGTVAYFFENLHVHEYTHMVRRLHALRLHA